MSHERVFYSCGCLRMQCRCLGPHVTRTLTYPCPKHTAGAFESRTYHWADGGTTVVHSADPDASLAFMARLEIETDRDRLLAEVWD